MRWVIILPHSCLEISDSNVEAFVFKGLFQHPYDSFTTKQQLTISPDDLRRQKQKMMLLLRQASSRGNSSLLPPPAVLVPRVPRVPVRYCRRYTSNNITHHPRPTGQVVSHHVPYRDISPRTILCRKYTTDVLIKKPGSRQAAAGCFHMCRIAT